MTNLRFAVGSETYLRAVSTIKHVRNTILPIKCLEFEQLKTAGYHLSAEAHHR